VNPGSYLVGVAWLGVIIGALAFGAVRVRARLLPQFRGAPARLAEVTVGLGALVLVPELLGAVGWFRRVPVLLALLVVGVGAGLLAGRPDAGRSEADAEADTEVEEHDGVRPVRLGRWVTVAALAVATAVVAQWAGHVVSAYGSSSSGIWDGDSLWYHLPFATHFLQTGWVTRPLFTNADTLVTYFPGNSEIVLGTVMLPFRRDIAIPLVNVGWLLLTFLAAWCLGRRYGAPAVALAGAAVAMSLPVMAATQAGTARNDAMGVALFLAAVALVAHADWDRNAMAVAGVAAGLALGVKLSTVVPVALLAVAVVVAAPRARRWAACIPWAVSIVVFGSFWYVRNLVLVGNPVPTIGVHLGPLSLPSVFAESIDKTAVVDRLREPGAIGRVLRPGLHEGFGALWWLVLLGAVVISLVALVRGPDRVARMLGAVVLTGGLGYVLMPNGSPFSDTPLGAANFMLNLRYVLPVLALAAALTAVLPRMADARYALGAVGAFAVIAAVTLSNRSFTDHWEWAVSNGQRAAGVLVAVVAVALVVGVLRLPAGSRRWVVAVVVILAVAAGFLVQSRYLDRRYRQPRSGAEVKVSAVWPWAQDLDATRIGIVGTLIQYPYAGPKLGSTVRYVGVPTDDGGFRPARSCREFRERLVDGRFRYLVAAHDFFGSNVPEIDRINEWTRDIPGATLIRHTDTAWVYELPNRLDARACP